MLVQELQNDMWDLLQKRHQWKAPSKNFKVGDVVLLKDPNSIPSDWKMARVTKPLPDHQGRVRQVEVVNAQQETLRRATNQLIDLLPEDEQEDDPEPRRSKRIKAKRAVPPANMITTALVAWLMLTHPVLALLVHTLAPGTHVLNLSNAEVTPCNMEFALDTNLNFTLDMSNIDSCINDFHDTCSSLRANKLADLELHCFRLHKEIQQEQEVLRTDLQSVYNARHKRAVPALLAQAGSFALKHSGVIVLSGIVTYQGFEIASQRAYARGIEAKVKRVAELSLKTTDQEFEHVDHAIAALNLQQEKLSVSSQLQEHLSSIRGQIAKIKSKHEATWSYLPINELVEDFNNTTAPEHIGMKLPTVISTTLLLQLNPVEPSLNDGRVRLTFQVPLVHATEFKQLAILAVPESTGQSISLDNGQNFQRLLADTNNKTIFFFESLPQRALNLFEDVKSAQPSSCLRSILQSDDGICNCSNTMNGTATMKVIQTQGTDLIIVINQDESLNITCGNSTTAVTVNSFFTHLADCKLITSTLTFVAGNYSLNHQLSKASLELDRISPFEVEITHPTKSPAIEIARRALINEINTPVPQPDNDNYLKAAAVVVLVAVLIIIIVLVKQRRHSNRRNDDLELVTRRNFAKDPAL